MTEQERIKIIQERNEKLKVIEYKVEELMKENPDRKDQEVPIAGGQMVEAYSGHDDTESLEASLEDYEEADLEFEESEAEKEKRPALSVFTTDLAIAYDESSHKYPVTANRSLKPKSLARVLNKGGRYIFNLGLVNLFEYLILNMFLVIYCYRMEAELIKDMQEEGKSDPTV